MTRIGALMSPGLVTELMSALDGLAVSVVNLGPTASGVAQHQLDDVQGVVVELSEGVLDCDTPTVFGSPTAGIPVNSRSEDIARDYGIELVLGGPEDLERFVGSLIRPEPTAGLAPGRIIAVWGPPGAPGRTTIALAAAWALASRGQRVVLIDGDTYAPALAPALGLTPSQPGVIAASRMARLDGCDATALMATTIPYTHDGVSCAVMTGLRSPAQFADCPGTVWPRVLTTLTEAGYLVVIDVAAPLEHFPHEVVGGPVRNALTMATLESADVVLAVARATPLSILRLSRSWPRFRELAPAAGVEVVLNALPTHSEKVLEESTHALWQFTGIDRVLPISHDRTLVQPRDSGAEALSASARRGALASALAPWADAIAPRHRVAPAKDTPGSPGPAPGLAAITRWFMRPGKRLL